MELFEKIIADCINDDMEELAEALRTKQQELGEDITEAEARAAIAEVMESMLSDKLGYSVKDDNDEETEAYIDDAVGQVTEILDQQGWHYHVAKLRADLSMVGMNIRSNGVPLKIEIYVEDNPKVVRAKAILPFNAEKAYVLPVTKVLAKINYGKRYGGFLLDEEDGELCYEYSWRVGNGIYKNDVIRYIRSVMNSASDDDDYPKIRKVALGMLKRKDREALLAEIAALKEALEDED